MKLFASPQRHSIVSRPHLIAKLNDGLNGRLTLASAPAGFGKSTLIAAWLGQLDSTYKSAWLSLDENDNDPIQFFAYFVGALQTVYPTVGKELGASPTLPPLAAAMQLLLHELAALSQPLVLVLDDYHFITAPDIHDAMASLLTRMPPQLHLVIISRADPPFSLSKLRVRHQMAEVRARDLRFSEDEAAEFLNQTMGLSLSAEEISLLEKRTEGWIGGLQLAALSIPNEEDRAAFITAFAGDDRYVADYLLEEVLQAQPAAIQSFLLQSSILKRLSGALCDAVMERQDSQAVLEYLEQSNLFILPMDNRRKWYRYHRLFADLLQARLASSPETARLGHQRASQWYADNQLWPEAVEHALAGEDYEGAIELILLHAAEYFMSSRLLTLRQWWQRLPETLRDRNLKLGMMMAWAMLATGNQPASEQCLQKIEQALGATPDALLRQNNHLDTSVRNSLIEVAAVRLSYQSVNRADSEETLSLCQRILPFLVPEESDHLFSPLFVLRPVVLFNMGLSLQSLGRLEEAAAAFEEAKEQGKTFVNVHIVASSFGHLAELRIIRGELSQAAESCQRGLDTINALASKSSPMSGLLHIQLGAVHYERNELTPALQHVQKSISLALPWRNLETLLPAYLSLARIGLALGQRQTAQSALKDFDNLVGSNAMFAGSADMANHVWLQAVQGVTEPAWRWADALKDIPSLSDERAIVWARIRLLQGRADDLLPHLDARLEAAERQQRYGHVISLLVLRSLAYDAQGDRETAVNSLARAVTIAEPQRYVRAFVDGGEAVAGMLRDGLGHNRLSSYAQVLLDAFDLPPQTANLEASHSSGQAQLIEPLSERELEILGLIAQGMTNKEIGVQLHISVGTVKVHAHNVYGKLAVSGRTKAVAKARSLKIVP